MTLYVSILSSRAQHPSSSPASDCKDKNDPSHEESGEPHDYREDEHGVEVVVFHKDDAVLCLQNPSVQNKTQGSLCAKLTLPMKMRPPEIKQNAATSSEGGREAKLEVGGETYKSIYVTARASAKMTNSIPHCLWTIVATTECC